MKQTFQKSLRIIACAAVLVGLFSFGQTNSEEESGIENNPPREAPVPDPAARQRALAMLGNTGLLLIPESSNDRVMAFDPITGDLIDPDFIPSDPINLSTPISAIPSFDGTSILVSDQTNDQIVEYDMDGNFVRILAGGNTNILDNIRGIAITPAGTLVATVGSGLSAGSLQEFDENGNHLGAFIAAGSGGLESPFDILFRATDNLVGGITSDTVHRYDNGGTYLDDFTAINTFPEQISQTASGNILIGNFDGTEEGVVEYTAAGSKVGVYAPGSLSGYRGAWELGNGNILTTTGAGVHEIDRAGNLVETKIDAVSARFIEYYNPLPPCDAVTLSLVVDQNMSMVGTPGCIVDIYDSNCSDDSNDWVLIQEGLVIPENGILTTNIIVQPDTCYAVTQSTTINLLNNAAVSSVPTLGTWGLLGFLALLAGCGLVIVGKSRK